MRLSIVLIAAAMFMLPGAAHAQADDGFDGRGVDRYDRTPDWNYRRGEAAGKGAYYDGGRYGPRGLLSADAALHPWLSDLAARSVIAARTPARANRWFARRADRNRDARLTDAEIALALATMNARAR